VFGQITWKTGNARLSLPFSGPEPGVLIMIVGVVVDVENINFS